MMKVAFWLASFLVVYPYLIYPVLLRVLARRGPVHAPALILQEPPSICLIISAHNEEKVIAEKLGNATALDYPVERLEIIVVSDASSDRTDDIVRRAQARDPRIRLLRQDEHRGKSAGLNKALEIASAEIIVFSDANAIYDRNAVRELARCFADPKVGYVVGAALYHDASASRAAENEGLYWKLEMLLKRLESDYYSVVGGDGALYAIRRRLFRPLQDDDISDFVNPLQIVAAGYRGQFNAKAFCYEAAAETFAKEFGRKRRIVNRSWRAVRRYAHLLRFERDGRFIFMLLSHKVIRWLTLPLVGVAWLTNGMLLGSRVMYTLTWCAITGSILLACLGAALERAGRLQPRLIAMSYYFYLVNLAGLLGIWDEYRGVRYVTWDHVRRTRN
jgi:cellulose synthase/poly-beta-1,6-N-acetylglucosamine synthase-like glycosyltransferase